MEHFYLQDAVNLLTPIYWRPSIFNSFMTEVPIIKNVSIDLQTGFNMIGTSDMKELNGTLVIPFISLKTYLKDNFVEAEFVRNVITSYQ